MGFHWKLTAAFVALFVVGGLCGSVLTYSFARPEHAGGRRGPHNWAAGLCRQMEAQVRLSPDQVAAFRPEIEEAVRRVEEARRRTVIDSDLEIDAALERIATRLNPDQAALMERFRARRRARVLNWVARHS